MMVNSVLFVGLVGFLMHLARAVDCRATFICGGRELPSLSVRQQTQSAARN
jgi:hypothetical protein